MTKNKLLVKDKELEYRIRRSKKAKRIGIKISRDFLLGDTQQMIELVVPEGESIKKAETFLHSKKDWIAKKLKQKVYNGKFYYLGREISVYQQYDMFRRNYRVIFEDDKLVISSPSEAAIDKHEVYISWLRARAKEYIPKRVMKIANEYDFNGKRISIRNQKTRWGSCSNKGMLSFNCKLMAMDRKTIDYVIVHELCHLKEMNHTKKFWKLVEEIIPDYDYYRKKLRL